ncbi:MAG: hypothetical protein SGPRY_005117 [Prymnesium sp.]
MREAVSDRGKMEAMLERLAQELPQKGAELLRSKEARLMKRRLRQLTTTSLSELQSKLREDTTGGQEDVPSPTLSDGQTQTLSLIDEQGEAKSPSDTSSENARLIALASKVEGLPASKFEPVWAESARKWEQTQAARNRRNQLILAVVLLTAAVNLLKLWPSDVSIPVLNRLCVGMGVVRAQSAQLWRAACRYWRFLVGTLCGVLLTVWSQQLGKNPPQSEAAASA